ncbi:MAG: hypothetical protein PVI75_06700 [Gammaproteobacteria bacterium]|jgi:hypothetical protein
MYYEDLGNRWSNSMGLKKDVLPSKKKEYKFTKGRVLLTIYENIITQHFVRIFVSCPMLAFEMSNGSDTCEAITWYLFRNGSNANWKKINKSQVDELNKEGHHTKICTSDKVKTYFFKKHKNDKWKKMTKEQIKEQELYQGSVTVHSYQKSVNNVC